MSHAAALLALGLVAYQASEGGHLPTLLALALALGCWRLPSRPVAAWAAAMTLAASTGLLWQAAMVVAAGLLALSPALRPDPPWLGRVPPLPTLVAGGVAPVALGIWMFALEPDLSDLTRLVEGLPLVALLILAVGFALANAALEEILWRGYLQPHLTLLFGPMLAILLQAASFGAQHAHGVPRGLVGMLLAGLWAVLLGMLRHHARGLLAPFFAHVLADAAVAVIVMSSSQACQR